MVTLLILNIGTFMAVGFEKILLLYNPLTYPTADVISTYLYRVGIVSGNFSYAAAIGLFESVIGLTLVLSAQRHLPSHGGDEPVVTVDGRAAAAGRRRPTAGHRGPTRGYRVFQAVNAVVLTGVVVVTLYPFVNILARSFSDETYIVAGAGQPVPARVQPHHLPAGDVRPDVLDQLPQHRRLHGRRHRHLDGADHLLRLRAVQEAPARAAACWSASRCSPCSSTAA